jgi:hypothetical protein
MAFTLFHAEHLPLITLQAPVREPLPGGLSRITVTLRNDRLLPTRLDQDTLNHITRPDILSLTGNGLKVHTSGEVTDRYRNRIEAARRQPERVELQTIPGMAEVRVQFVVSGSGTALITFDSVKGGLRSATLTVP